MTASQAACKNRRTCDVLVPLSGLYCESLSVCKLRVMLWFGTSGDELIKTAIQNAGAINSIRIHLVHQLNVSFLKRNKTQDEDGCGGLPNLDTYPAKNAQRVLGNIHSLASNSGNVRLQERFPRRDQSRGKNQTGWRR